MASAVYRARRAHASDPRGAAEMALSALMALSGDEQGIILG